VLAGSIATTLSASGVSSDIIMVNALIAITGGTVISGSFLYGLGALRCGSPSQIYDLVWAVGNCPVWVRSGHFAPPSPFLVGNRGFSPCLTISIRL
jgi:hypothetical protein